MQLCVFRLPDDLDISRSHRDRPCHRNYPAYVYRQHFILCSSAIQRNRFNGINSPCPVNITGFQGCLNLYRTIAVDKRIQVVQIAVLFTRAGSIVEVCHIRFCDRILIRSRHNLVCRVTDCERSPCRQRSLYLNRLVLQTDRCVDRCRTAYKHDTHICGTCIRARRIDQMYIPAYGAVCYRASVQFIYRTAARYGIDRTIIGCRSLCCVMIITAGSKKCYAVFYH